MIKLPGYQVIEEIYSSDRTKVYRAAQELDGNRVILKYLANEYPSFTELVQFRHQYTLIKNLDLPGIVRPISLENYGNGYVLVMEDFGGISLRNYTQNKPLSIGEFLTIALQLVQTLNQLLQSRIIHKDIKPDNILINPESKQVKLIDFSIASVLPRETQEIFTPNVLEGTLAYISPEQTGRMNRGIDYRTDFYSLGVTFYELLTGQLPFAATDPIELIHCHIAKPPVSPKTRNSEIPDVLVEIILKLMAKNAEDRYQSAIGIWHDLETCFTEYTATGEIPSFTLATQDISDRLMIPEKLYGRETEVQILLEAFNQVANPAQPSLNQTGQRRVKLMVVTGFSGIGKSALVHEIHKPIIRQRGYFISGKYDQFQRDIPLSAIVRAFADLIRQLLTESEVSVQQWQEKIIQALGKNAQVIIDVIPELELLIGSQPPVEKLSGKAAKHRFNLLFQKFIQVFAAPEHPLVVFLDDLQWADSASLKLIQNLLGENEVNYLLLIGAYRDNEVFPAHPLMLMLQSLPNAEQSVAKITLKPLDFNSLNLLMADTLKCEPSVAMPLTELVESKTQGNPFFTIQFLKFLHQIGLIYYAGKSNDSAAANPENTDLPSGGYWQCDMAQIKALAISNDVVEFMASQLIKLPKSTQNMLKLAACIDNQFDLQTLAIVSEKSLGETASALWPALQEGLILPTSQAYKFFQDASLEDAAKIQDLSLSYKFLHDRVQQSAYALIDDEARKATHLKIGQLLWQYTSDKKQPSKIFDIANQLNYGIELLPSQEERYQLAELNLNAGKKAKASMAYASALKYLNTGVSLLAPESWHECYDLTVTLYLELAETEYFNTNYDRCEALGQVILSHADNLLDRIKIYELKIQIATAKNQLQEAVDIGLNVLKSLDITLVDALPTGAIVKDLHNLPKMTDPVKLAGLRILIMIAPAAYNGNPELVSLVTLTMVNICIQGGNSPWSAYAYAFYGVFLCSQMEEIETGYEFGRQALQVLDQFDDVEIKGKVYHLVNVGIRHWRESARDTIAPWLDTIQFALDAGDIEYACYAAMGYCIGIFLVGEPLDSVVAKQATYLKLMQKFKQEFPFTGTCLWGQMVLNLAGLSQPSNNPTCLIGELANEVTAVPILRENNNIQTLFVVYLGKTFLSYLFKDYEAAVANAAIASEYQQAMGGLLAIAQYPFYESLALLACYPQVDLSQQSAYLEKVAANQETMKIWATNAPMNFQHKYDLVEAEKARILGDNWLATELYERAIQGANKAGYIQEEALANELAAEFYLAFGRTKVAQTYLIDAYYAYARWGAKTKVEHLTECHRELLAPVFSNQTMEISTTTTVSSSSQSNLSVSQSMSSTGNSTVLDLLSAIKASQALSGEIYLDRLLAKLMQIFQENAGAQKCAIILPEEDDWAIATLSVLDPLSDPEIPPQLNWMNLGESREIPLTVIRYVQRTEETLILGDATSDMTFAADPYITEQKPKSILCMPFRNRGQIVGLLYLENQAIAKAFSRDRLEILQLFTAQAAISLENAKLYNSLEQQVQERTQELNEKNLRLKQAIQELKRTQSQMIYTEKMSSLGQIVAGIAHEINNPVSFIYGNIDHTCEYVEDLINLLKLYQGKYPHPDPEIQEEIEAIDLEFLQEDLEKILNSMKNGAERISHIVKSLRNFSRLDEAEMKPVDIHEGLESTLTLLKSRWQETENSPEIQVIKKYGKLPKVTCYASAINQVFMNILNNAFDVLSQANYGESNSTNQGADLSPPMIQISTELTNTYSVKIHIADNGPGINAKIQKKIFDPFFTTKPVGSGTGLGLSISYQVVVEKHRGKLSCISQPGKGAEFIIEIPVQPTAIADSKDGVEVSLMP